MALEFKAAISGHSIGRGIHKSPQLYTWVDESLLPGITMMFEVGYTDLPNDSYQLEDLILMRGRSEYLTEVGAPDQLWELGI